MQLKEHESEIIIFGFGNVNWVFWGWFCAGFFFIPNEFKQLKVLKNKMNRNVMD